jgi:hypothetical protein
LYFTFNGEKYRFDKTYLDGTAAGNFTDGDAEQIQEINISVDDVDDDLSGDEDSESTVNGLKKISPAHSESDKIKNFGQINSI